MPRAYSSSYRIIYAQPTELADWLGLFRGELPAINIHGLLVTLKPCPRPVLRKGGMLATMLEHWPNCKFSTVMVGTNPSIAVRIETPHGAFVAMRNGNNISKYNFVVVDLDKGEFYFRWNHRNIIYLIRMLVGDRLQLPLLIGSDMEPRNHRVLEQLLKQGA
jgi:hypothetical protein